MDIKLILEALKVDTLTEEQQTKIEEQINDIVELKVKEKLDEELETEKNSLIELYEEKFETYKEDITRKFSDFLDKILEEELVIPDEILENARKGELYGDLIEQFKIKIGIDEAVLDDEAKSLLVEASDEIKRLRRELNETIQEKILLESDAKEFAAELYKRKKCDGLPSMQKNRVLRLLEGITSVRDIDRKFEIIVGDKHLFEQDEEEDDQEETNECYCPKCDKVFTVKGACSLNSCDECEEKLQDKTDEGHQEVKTKRTVNEESPWEQFMSKTLSVLKEQKF
jgi:hypothetical protein